jgi:CDP-glycerol glycerophosphotransferase (TagB/SpsB family)
LHDEGFRLVPPGQTAKLLFLNCDHIVSSHAEYMDGTLAASWYGDMMRWRYAFLQHGVIKNDLSHWLSNRDFDLFVTTSPAEHASIVDDGTPYTYTDREVRRTGLPRHDRLLWRAKATPAGDVDWILVMPTWRANLVDTVPAAPSRSTEKGAIEATAYVRHWGSFLRSERLRDLAARHGRTIAFMPHRNAMPFIEAFDLPSHVRIVRPLQDSVQNAFCRTAAFVTDYTSVAFEMAFLRRIVFYYQFDRKAFFGGDHNWRAGYFDFDRDGFGPVADTEQQLLDALAAFLNGGSVVPREYLERMCQAVPEQDEGACQRTFDAIVSTKQPFSRAGLAQVQR